MNASTVSAISRALASISRVIVEAAIAVGLGEDPDLVESHVSLLRAP